jgi:hypothetical protein
MVAQPDYYSFKNEDGTEIQLKRVTGILKRCINKPELINWAYWRTIDSVSGLMGSQPSRGLDDVSTRELLEDSGTIDEWLRLNRMRPDDLKEEASSRGEGAHELLARLAQQQQEGVDLDGSLAHTIADSEGGYLKGVADWWMEARPHVQASEKLLYSLDYGGYAGRCDLVVDWFQFDAHMAATGPAIVDLKTRKLPLRIYTTDMLQLEMYAHAYESMTGIKPYTWVLLVGPDGTFSMSQTHVSPDTVEHLIGLDKELRRLEEGR